MPFQIIGEIIDNDEKVDFKIKPYKSKIYYTEETALKDAYKKVYHKDGNTKRRKNVLVNFYIKTIRFGDL
jgi:predicted HTH transcriptional regulator